MECEAGVAGDMLVGALLDLGADEEKLVGALHSLPLAGYEIAISRVKKAGIDACDFNVILDEAHENHDHDMEYLHGEWMGEAHHHHHEGHDHEHGNGHHHEGHDHEHGDGHHHHDHGDGHHHHVHRHLADIYQIIDGGDLTEGANRMAKRIFEIVAESEAKAHAMPIEEVHFHEVGAVDSIVDIVAIAVCMDDLGISELIVPYLCEGQGTVRCAHGILPIPVPAVQNIAESYGIPLKRMDVRGEFVTPTGAAAVAAFRARGEAGLPDAYIIKRSGIGAGKRNYERASLVRIMEIEAQGEDRIDAFSRYESEETADHIWRLETDIDDMTGERLGYCMGLLYEKGAREVHFVPIQMKKNRPGVELVVICDEAHREELEALMFAETTTIGIRRMRMERSVLPREIVERETPLGKAVFKKVRLPGGAERVYPEFEAVASMAREHHLSFYEVLEKLERHF